jgi:Zn-dependent membrane protease YugP
MIDLLALIPILGLPAIAALYLKATASKYSKVPSKRGITGQQTAALLLKSKNINDVGLKPVPGSLSDHYGRGKTQDKKLVKYIGLSEPVFGQTTLTALGVAAHEVGHAVQYETKYKPIMLKSGIRPIANLGSKAGPLVVAAGLAVQEVAIMDIGILCYAVALLVSLITLPCEFNASKRGLAMLMDNKVITQDELKGTKKVLKAAALTYVAGTLTSIGTLATLLLRRKRVQQIRK